MSMMNPVYLSREERERIEASASMDWLADDVELVVGEAELDIEEAQRFIATLGDDLAFY